LARRGATIPCGLGAKNSVTLEPLQSTTNAGNHAHTVLGPGVPLPAPLRGYKHGKHADSASFGFSVSTGHETVEIGDGSTLTTSDDGVETWMVRGATLETLFEAAGWLRGA